MPRIPGVNHLVAIKGFQKAGFVIERQGKHVIMSRGGRILVIPRHNPIHAVTMAIIVKDSGLTIEEFKRLV